MTRAYPLAAALLLFSACDRAAPPPVENNVAAPIAAPAKPAPPPAAPFEYKRENDLLEFDYSWSAEVSAIPELVARFTRDMNTLQARLAATARDDKAEREKSDFPFNAYSSSTGISTAGQTPRLLSLQIESGEYTGGAHPNHGTTALLWDRQAKREIKFAALFTDPANSDRVLRQRWCNALDKARTLRRGGTTMDGPFGECPTLDEIAILPTDKDGDGKFERLTLVASPYVAGPYAEGDYEVVLPVDAATVAVLKGDYRPSFQPQ